MQLIESIEALRLFRQAHANNAFGFVPTMGALHQGHGQLIKQSAQENDCTIASVFVNPTQFSPGEDLDQYPRTLKADIALAKEAGADAIFAPSKEAMYPGLQSIGMTENQFSRKLCGAYRTGHFDGVCLVVHKLLNLVHPTHVYFGKKDAQQLRILQAMVQEMHIPVVVQGVETVREKSGLAMSSRNKYLSSEEKKQAAALSQSLTAIREAYHQGETNPSTLISIASDTIKQYPLLKPQYISILDWQTFNNPSKANDQCFAAMAVYVGKTRLIDNIFLSKSVDF